MSKESVKKFYEALKNDKAMAEELKTQFAAGKPEPGECAAKLMVKLAAEKGYAFTVEDLKALETETKSLDKDELDKINAAGDEGVGHGRVCRGLLWF